jgi:O-antigen ligase
MDALSRRPLAVAGGIILGLASALLVERHRSIVILLCIALVAIVGLAMLGDRAFPWAIVIVAVAPWFPLYARETSSPVVERKEFAAAIAAAVLVPWLWSLAAGIRGTRPSRASLLMALLFAGLTVVIYETLGGVSQMTNGAVVGFPFLGVAFLCARRFDSVRAWPTAAFAGLLILAFFGSQAYFSAPNDRLGYFVGYPITFGALIVGLLPLALLFAAYRSRLLAGFVAAVGVALLIFSESRSGWIAAIVMLIVLVGLLARGGNFRPLALVGTTTVVAIVLVLATGSLNKVIERRINAKTASSISVTHRTWSYGYAFKQIEQRPLFGAGVPGFAATEAENRTDIGALDNGYLSITVDMGLVGLVAVLIPIAVALRALAGWLRLGVAPPVELAMALGVLGIAVVTIFYDSFYWAQLDLLLGAMGGVLSVRLRGIARQNANVEQVVRPARPIPVSAQ